MSNKISSKSKLFNAIVLTVGLFVVLLGGMIGLNDYKKENGVKKDSSDYIALKSCNIYASGGYANSTHYDSPKGTVCGNSTYATPDTSTYCYMQEGSYWRKYHAKVGYNCKENSATPSITTNSLGKEEISINAGNGNLTITCSGGGCTSKTTCDISNGNKCQFNITAPSSLYSVGTDPTCKYDSKNSTVSIDVSKGYSGPTTFYSCSKNESSISYISRGGELGNNIAISCKGNGCVKENSNFCNNAKGTCTFTVSGINGYFVSTDAGCNNSVSSAQVTTFAGQRSIYYACPAAKIYLTISSHLSVTCSSQQGACYGSTGCFNGKGNCTFDVRADNGYFVGLNDCSSASKNSYLINSIYMQNTPYNLVACPKNSYSSSGGTYTPIPEPPVEDNKTVTKNQFFYANGTQYQGNSIKCGDKVYVTTCSKGDNAICNVTSINKEEVSTTTQIYEKDLVTNLQDTGCYQKIERYIAEKTYYYSDRKLSKNKTEIGCGSVVTFKQEIKNACVNKSCEVEYNDKTVYINIDYITSDKPACQNQNTGGGNTGGNTSENPGGNTGGSTSSGTNTCVTSKSLTGVKGDVTVSICKKDDTEDTKNKIVTCAEDYTYQYRLTKDTCKDNNSENCYKEYIYTCSYIKRPGVNASAGAVGSNGKGIITVTGVPYGNIGILGYHVSSGDEPTVNSGWSTFNAVNNSFSIERSAGTYFIWAINNKRRISYPVLAKVYDADLSTTLASFKVQDGNGNDINTNISSLDGTVGYTTGVKDSKYALLSNSLIADSVGGFDKLTTSYELSVNSNKIALYATLTSSDASYVSGFEPRTIDLEYGRNVALIKIVNKDGKERCYTFIINRVDDRNNSNLLKNVKLSRGSIDFDPYTTNYDVKISRFTKKVSINAELDSSTSTFISGYEPREVEITEDRQSVVLKVISEAGSIRSYVITFIRNGEDKDNVNSTYLSSLTVPGTMLGFDKETYDYTITVPYETEDLPIYAFAESETASVTVGNNTGLKVGNNLIQIEVKNNNKTRIYSLHVIRKESGLDISNSARLGTLSIKNYNIEFSPDKLDYEVKIKREKTLLISATPESNRADIYMYGNNDLTGFSTIRVKVIAENGLTNIYSIDIQKAAYNKKIEIIASVAGVSVLLIVSLVIYLKKKNNKRKEYLEG